MEAAVTKIVCGNHGSMDYCDLLANTGFDVCRYPDARERLLLVDQTVVARTKVRLCKARECRGCNNLHLCKFFLYGDCPHSRKRRGCYFCHDLTTEHNATVLNKHNLQQLERHELCILLLQNDISLLPPVCIQYNQGNGDFGNCTDEESCRRLHICHNYIKGTCKSGVACSRNHNFLQDQPNQTLVERGIPQSLISSMFPIYKNMQALKSSNNNHPKKQNSQSDAKEGRKMPGKGPEKDGEIDEICLYYVRGMCKYGDRCNRAHSNLPYRWEVRTSLGRWSYIPENEEIERDFCNPCKTYSTGIKPVCFDTMTQDLYKVRRLSTVSSVLQPTFLLTTEWAWYWQDEFGNWIQYSSNGSSHSASSVTSQDLEQKFQEDNNGTIEFTAGSQTYEIRMHDMIQTNKRYGTKKLVRRRPVYVSAANALEIKTSKRIPNNLPSFKRVPGHWDKSKIPDSGYQKVILNSSTKEYTDIVAMFQKTMFGFSISQIERIQNKALWEVFQWQREQMQRNSSGRQVTERKLFHGTDAKHTDAICKQNFDWRICGTHGTAYGKGSYFARDAKYSHSYTDSSGRRIMFVCRVLVGDYTRGDSSYLRPPSKDGGDAFFYDSCVDNTQDPSIFVVFEKHQIYPEYLIHYNDSGVSSPSYSYRRPTVRVSQAPTPTPTYNSGFQTTSAYAGFSGVNNTSATSPTVHRTPPTTYNPGTSSSYNSYSSKSKDNASSCTIS